MSDGGLEPVMESAAEALSKPGSLQNLAQAQEQTPVVLDPKTLMKDIYLAPSAPIPEDIEVTKAKSYLKQTVDGKVSLYDHLASVVMRVLETRPADALDKFEEISAQQKRSAFVIPSEAFVPSEPNVQKQIDSAMRHLSLAEEVGRIDPESIGDVPDLLEMSRHWEWAGVSLGKDETFQLFLELKQLSKEHNLKSVRMWGKILGTERNYYVAEGDTGEEPQEPEEEPQAARNEEAAENDIPKPKLPPAPRVTPEINAGVNKYAYFVINEIGDKWTRLPNALPQKIQVSRSIKQYFTGDLERPVISYPPFEDNEAQLLRCQIARISASTVVAPANYYIPDPEAGEGEENAGPKPIIVNPEYESTPNEEFLNLDNWVHHVPYILPQGRVVWQNPYPKPEGEEEGEENQDNQSPEVEPEESKNILAPISGDEDENGVSWTVTLASRFLSAKQSPVVLRSLRWPGAVSVVHNDKFSNLYIGFGVKDAPNQKLQWPQLPEVQKEWAPVAEDPEELAALELKEQVDPTVEQEEAYEDSLQEKKESEDDNEEKGEEA